MSNCEWAWVEMGKFSIFRILVETGVVKWDGTRQGIFLNTDCVPFWDAAPFHRDAAPQNFQSLRPKRKTLLMHIKIKLNINEVIQKTTAYPRLPLS